MCAIDSCRNLHQCNDLMLVYNLTISYMLLHKKANTSPENDDWKMNILLMCSFFRGHVNYPGWCIYSIWRCFCRWPVLLNDLWFVLLPLVHRILRWGWRREIAGDPSCSMVRSWQSLSGNGMNWVDLCSEAGMICLTAPKVPDTNIWKRYRITQTV